MTNDILKSTDPKHTLAGIHIARVSTVPFFVLTQLKQQIKETIKSGANVSVVTSEGAELELLRKEPIRCVTIDIPRYIAPWRDMLGLIRLFIYLKREQIQIVHSTTPKAGLLTALAAFFAGVPIRLHTFTGQPWLYMGGIKRWVLCNCDRLIGVLNTRCYADSASQRQFLVDQQVIKSERIFNLGAGSLAGVDVCRFEPDRFSSKDCAALRDSLGIKQETLVFLFVGRLTSDKGLRELLCAFEIVKGVETDTHLIFVGQFDSKSGVSGTISQKDIESIRNTTLIGFSNCPEEYMAIADVLCLPSYREGFGTVVIEAAAMGVPTIGTNIYGLSDAIVHGKTGLLVEPRNVEDLAEAMLKLITDKALLSQMSVAAQERVRLIFESGLVNRLVVEEYLTLLRNV